MDAVVVDHVSKNYRIYARPSDRLRELFFRSRKFHQDFWALRNISFRIRQGSTFGIIGENGSGKSTLLQVIAGTLQPTQGTIRFIGRVAALLELGAGFNPEFTGRENVFLNGAILGLSQEEIIRKMPEIERFAEIGSFIDQPIKTYSSGMYVRLAFAVSIHVDPEILLVDESLSVGDVYFQQRCMRKIRQMKQEGKTILFVSHDLAAVKNLCDAALWLERGEVMELGEPDKVVSRYLAAMTLRRDPYATENSPNSQNLSKEVTTPAESSDPVVRSIPNIDHRWGNRQAEILGVMLLDSKGEATEQAEPGDCLTLRVSVKFNEGVDRPIVGFIIRNRLGEDISGINTSAEGHALPPALPSFIYTIDFHMQLPVLCPGNYSFSAAIANGTYEDFVICDLVENAISLALKRRTIVYGYMKFECRIETKYVGTTVGDGQEVSGRS